VIPYSSADSQLDIENTETALIHLDRQGCWEMHRDAFLYWEQRKHSNAKQSGPQPCIRVYQPMKVEAWRDPCDWSGTIETLVWDTAETVAKEVSGGGFTEAYHRAYERAEIELRACTLDELFAKAATARDKADFRSDHGHWEVGIIDPLHAAEEATVDLMADVWVAFAFCYCTNVGVDEHRVPEKKRRQYEKKGRPAPTRYYTLNIEPMRRALSAALAGDAKGDLARAFHICRGHFKTYTESAPLFGRHVGAYLWPQHLRGKGPSVISKDYSV
jgi:hypothetical protein